MSWGPRKDLWIVVAVLAILVWGAFVGGGCDVEAMDLTTEYSVPFDCIKRVDGHCLAERFDVDGLRCVQTRSLHSTSGWAVSCVAEGL